MSAESMTLAVLPAEHRSPCDIKPLVTGDGDIDVGVDIEGLGKLVGSDGDPNLCAPDDEHISGIDGKAEARCLRKAVSSGWEVQKANAGDWQRV